MSDFSSPVRGPFTQVTTFAKTDVTATGQGGAWTTANTGLVLFTVTGHVFMRIVGVFTALMASTGTTGTLAVGTAAQTTLMLGTTTMNGTNGILNSVWTDTAPTVTAKAMAAATDVGYLVANANIVLTIATNNMTAGGCSLYCFWQPLSSGAKVS